MKLAKGSTFWWDGKKVGELTNIDGLERTAEKEDTTTHDSAEDGYTTSMQGWKTASDVKIEGNFKPEDAEGQLALNAAFETGEVKTAMIKSKDGNIAQSFPGYVSSAKIGGNALKGGIGFSATITPTGKPTLSIGASGGLTNLVISNSAVLYPAFAADKYDFDATVLTGVSSVTITPTASSHTITIEVNGVTQTVNSGSASTAITLGAAGSKTDVVITAQESGKVAKRYTLSIDRAGA